MKTLLSIISFVVVSSIVGCDNTPTEPPKSSSGVSKTSVKIPLGPDGLTAEQRNVRDRLLKDNEPGAIKHLYVISAYSGQVLIYSTVKGKITSSGKRLTPTSINGGYSSGNGYYGGFDVDIGGDKKQTNEVLQDDGVYGSSSEYVFWFDSKGTYHQHYVQGGQILHVSSEPLSVKGVVINMELNKNDEPTVPAISDTPVKTNKK